MLSKPYRVVVAIICFAASILAPIEAVDVAKTLISFQARPFSGRSFSLKLPRSGSELHQTEQDQVVEPVDNKTKTPPTNGLKDISYPWPEADTAEAKFASDSTPEKSPGSPSIETESSPAQKSSKSQVVATAFAGLAGLAITAKAGILSGPYTDAYIVRDFLSTFTTAGAAVVLVQIFTAAAEKGILEPRDSRKLIHTLSGPLFILTWPVFSPAAGARVFCAVVPLLNMYRLYRAGTGPSSTSSNTSNDTTDPDVALAKAVSRSGDASEALGGPFIYASILFSFVLLFWRNSPVGVVSLATMAAGDGMADLIGRRYGKNNKWPGLEKSVAGSLAFWIAATITSTALLAWMNYWQCWTIPLTMEWIDLVGRLALITLAAALLELVPIADDNYTVPISTAIMTYLFLSN